jgi:hypothetical protein
VAENDTLDDDIKFDDNNDFWDDDGDDFVPDEAEDVADRDLEPGTGFAKFLNLISYV